MIDLPSKKTCQVLNCYTGSIITHYVDKILMDATFPKGLAGWWRDGLRGKRGKGEDRKGGRGREEGTREARMEGKCGSVEGR